jgi:hypothetical protein
MLKLKTVQKNDEPGHPPEDPEPVTPTSPDGKPIP